METGVLLKFVLGGVLLVGGAELLVRGASRLALAAGITPLVVGLTVVAFGTSAPEMAVTVGSAWTGNAEVALGNVVGSNLFNLLFILGLSALLAPLVVAQQLVRLDVPLLIGVSLLFLVMALDGAIGRVDGAVLFAGVVAYTAFLVRQSRREAAAVEAEYQEALAPAERKAGLWALNVGLLLVGLALLVAGARWLVDAAVATATALGVSELVIGLTIVAAGTSLPEAATSVLAGLRGERDIAVGNVIGSCLFNLLAVMGLAGAVSPGGVPVPPGALTFDIPVMVAATVATLPIFFTGYAIARWEGLVFLAYYAAYTVFLLLQATRHHALWEFSVAMRWFVMPLTGLTLAVLAFRAWRADPREPAAPGG